MLILLALGIVVAVAREPAPRRRARRALLPRPVAGVRAGADRLADLVTGVMVLGLPQAGLTLGNAIVTTVDENNQLFPERPTTVRMVAIDHGIMNLVGTALGGVPMCHGAGGMAGHVRFGARTGGALVMLGILVLFVGLFLADSVETLFRLFPPALLGVILMFGGLELAAGVRATGGEKAERYVVLSPPAWRCGTWAPATWRGLRCGTRSSASGCGSEGGQPRRAERAADAHVQCPLIAPGPSGPWKISGFSGPSTTRKPARPRSSRDSEWSTRM